MGKHIGLISLLTLMLPIYSYSATITSSNTQNISYVEKASLESNKLKHFLLEYGYKEIPLRFSKDKNFLLIDVSLDDKRINRPFILDTGATQTSIDKEIQNKYKFKKHGKYITTGGAGGNYFRTYQVIIPTIQIGHFNARHQLATIQHYGHILIDKKPIAGMIGLDFLRENNAILDIQNHRMFFKTHHNKPLSQKVLEYTLNQMNYELIKLKRSSSGHQTSLVKINDAKPVSFMLDSGISPLMLDYKYAKRIQINIAGVPTIGKGSSNGEMKIYNAEINKLAIGPMSSGPQPIIITTGLEFAKIGIPVLGIIGLNWMRSHQAIMDTSNDFLFVKAD